MFIQFRVGYSYISVGILDGKFMQQNETFLDDKEVVLFCDCELFKVRNTLRSYNKI